MKTGEFLARFSSPQRILEVGCGYGRDLVYLKGLGHEVVGVDFSSTALELARSFAPDGDFVKSDVSKLPYSDGSFDVVYGYFVLHLLDSWTRAAMLRESVRVLRPGGFLFQTVASAADSDFGEGVEQAPCTFVNKRGVLKYYYTREAVNEEFSAFDTVEIDEERIHHTHGEPHDHSNFFIIARRPDTGRAIS